MPAGRPTKLTSELIDKVRNFSQIGMTWEDFATFAGVGLSTVRFWRRIGEKETERRTRGRTPIAEFDLHVELLAVTKRARLSSKYACMQKIMEVGFGGKDKPDGTTYPNWQALAWLLERQYPDEFALASRTKLAELAEQMKVLKKS